MSRPGYLRGDTLAIGLLVLLSVALWAPRLAGPLDLRYDAGVYYILGTALAEGQGYRLLNEPGAIQAIQYPPLLSAIVAVHQWLVGTSDPAVAGHALRCSFAVIFFVYVLAIFRLARRWLDTRWALVATLLVLLHIEVTWRSDLLFAELVFASSTIGFLLLAESSERRWAPALLGTAAYLLRSTGIALFAAWVLDAVLRRRFREALWRAALAALPVVVWQAYISGVQGSPEYHQPAYEYQRAAYQFYNVGYLENMAYVDPFEPERGRVSTAEIARRVTTNMLGMPVALGESVSGDRNWVRVALERLPESLRPASAVVVLVKVLFALLGLSSFVGLCGIVARGARLLPLYWAGSLLLIVLTPWPAQFGRYLMPLAPLTALGLVNGIVTVWRRWPSRILRRTLAFGLIGILVAQVLALIVIFTQQHYKVVGGDYRLFFYDKAWQSHDAAIQWLAGDAPRDAVIATATPHWVYLSIGRRAVFPPFTAAVDEAERLLESVPVDYLIIDEIALIDFTRRYALPVVRAFPDRWTLVHETTPRGSSIYRRARP